MESYPDDHLSRLVDTQQLLLGHLNRMPHIVTRLDFASIVYLRPATILACVNQEIRLLSGQQVVAPHRVRPHPYVEVCHPTLVVRLRVDQSGPF